MLVLYNYILRKVEEFKPIGKTVGLYTCGPTVYDFVHIGNWRTFVFEDILKRVLVFNGYKVKHVMNLTDIDDKVIKRAKDEKTTIAKLTQKYSDAFFSVCIIKPFCFASSLSFIIESFLYSEPGPWHVSH